MDENLKIAKVLSSEQFYKDVDNLVRSSGLKYIDAVVYYCEKNNIEIEAAASMIKGNFRIKSFVQSEGEELNYLPKTAKLPI